MRTHYRIAELADLTGIARSTLYDACNRGEIEVLRLGRAIYIPQRSAEKLIGQPSVSDRPTDQTDWNSPQIAEIAPPKNAAGSPQI